MIQKNSIRDFYNGKEIFLTGASGFVGKFLLEKLLRSCSGVKKIYVLIRDKYGKSGSERLNALLENSLFNNIRKNDPKQLEKVELILGDCGELNLGISSEDLERIRSVQIIFHSAASVKFADVLRRVILSHIRGAQEICKIAESVKDLEAFVFVSTAYSNPNNEISDEMIYETKFDWRKYIKLAENIDEETMMSFEKKLIFPFPNTYSITKNLAEHVCLQFEKRLPLVILRPSIVAPSEVEPERGRVDSLSGTLALMFAFTSGLCRTLYSFDKSGLDLIPVDICVKGIIVSAWKKWKDRKIGNQENKLDIYNCAAQKFLSLEEVKNIGKSITDKHPFKYMLWKPDVFLTSSKLLSFLNIFFMQFLPALMLDQLMILFKKDPVVVNALRKLIIGYETGKAFILNHTKIINKKFKSLDTALMDCDRDEFFMKETVESKEVYVKTFHEAMLKQWFNQTEDETKAALKRLRIMKIFDFVFWKSIYLGIAYFCCKYLICMVLNK